MKRFWLIGCCVLFLSSWSLAKDKLTSQWNCPAKPADMHSIDAGDGGKHLFVVAQESCMPAKSSLGEKQGLSTQVNQASGDSATWNGVFVSTTESGDKIYYGYSGKGMMKGDQFQSGTDKWWMEGGTGKYASAKGEGTCEGKGNSDGSVTWNCMGDYSMK